jgi:hypothetical protein
MHSAAPLRNMIKGTFRAVVLGGFAELDGAIAFAFGPLSLAFKDFGCIERSLSNNALELPCMRKTHAQMKLAKSKGFAEADFVVLQRLLNKRS